MRVTIIGFDAPEPSERIHALVFPSALDSESAAPLIARARTVTVNQVPGDDEEIRPGMHSWRSLLRRQQVCTVELPLVEEVALRPMDIRDPLEAITKALMDETGAIRHDAAHQAHIALQALVGWATEHDNESTSEDE